MRIADMKPNTCYATLEGDCVRTGDTITRGWNLVQRWRFQSSIVGHQRTLVSTVEITNTTKGVKLDPWSASSGDSHSKSGERDEMLVRDGVKLEKLPYDRAGTPDPGSTSRREVVLRPESIGGLWSDFVKLHPSRIFAKFVENDARIAQETLRDLLRDEVHTELEFPARTSRSDLRAAAHVNVNTINWTSEGRQTWRSHGDVVDFTLVPSITFEGADVVNMLLIMLGRKATPVFGPQSDDPAEIKKHVKKVIAGLVLAPEPVKRCDVSDLLVTDCGHCAS